MTKERIILWGTGNVALQTFHKCMTINQYEILAFVDNNKMKWGSELFDIKVCSPDYILENQKEIDRIVILANSYKEIKDQIIGILPELENIIENKYYFYKRSIIERYNKTENQEIRKVLDYLDKHSLDVFNYEYVEEYDGLIPEVIRDESNGLLYVIHNGKKMYFSRKYADEESVKRYYRSICVEQDPNSPHRYITDDFNVKNGGVVIDVGVAEGNFSLDIIDYVKKIYLIEADPLWVEALTYTFEPYKDKVEIIKKYVTSYNEGDFATIDAVIHNKEKINFIKLDIEGYEWDALLGTIETIKRADDIRIVACCYHSDFDQILIEDFFEKNNMKHSTTSGYMWFPSTCRQSSVSTRLNKGVIRGTKE